jgi:hypothetical protein
MWGRSSQWLSRPVCHASALMQGSLVEGELQLHLRERRLIVDCLGVSQTADELKTIATTCHQHGATQPWAIRCMLDMAYIAKYVVGGQTSDRHMPSSCSQLKRLATRSHESGQRLTQLLNEAEAVQADCMSHTYCTSSPDGSYSGTASNVKR